MTTIWEPFCSTTKQNDRRVSRKPLHLLGSLKLFDTQAKMAEILYYSLKGMHNIPQKKMIKHLSTGVNRCRISAINSNYRPTLKKLNIYNCGFDCDNCLANNDVKYQLRETWAEGERDLMCIRFTVSITALNLRQSRLWQILENI